MDLMPEIQDGMLSSEDQKVLKWTEGSKSYDCQDQRYKVAIPWIEHGRPTLPQNFELARRRLLSLEKMLLRKPKLIEKYREGMDQNVKKGYLRKVDNPDVKEGWYLPHFPVVREDKETTKVRIVFDSAAKWEGVCLNDRMHAGPKLQTEIFDILVRFRVGQIGLAGDIKEMFSQVLLTEEDRPLHRILWRDVQVHEPIAVYESTRLTFGDKASPFLAQYVLQSHAQEHQQEFPLASTVCIQSTYMDDAIHAIDRKEEAIKLRKELSALLIKAGFYIRRWCTNEPEVLVGVPPEDRAAGIVEVNDTTMPSIKTLGVTWNAETDCFGFAAQKIEAPEVMTKRT